MSKASQRKLSNKHKNTPTNEAHTSTTHTGAVSPAHIINSATTNTRHPQSAQKSLPQRPTVSKPSLPQRAARKR